MILKNKKHFFTETKRIVFIVSFLALSLIHFAVFWCYINFDTIRMTFFRVDKITHEEIFVGLEEYAILFRNIFLKEDIKAANGFWNSFHAVSINLIILPIAVVVAYCFYKKVYGHKFFRIIFYLPSVISIVVLAAAFREMFRQYNNGFETMEGPVAQILSLIGINKNWLDTMKDTEVKWPLIYTFAILNGMGANVILITSAMNRIPKEVSEASRIDGAGFFREMTSVTIPLVMPTITTWVMMIFASVYSFFMQPMLIFDYNTGKDGMFSTTPMEIFNLVAGESIGENNLLTAARLGIILTLIILPINLAMRALLNRFTAEVSY